MKTETKRKLRDGTVLVASLVPSEKLNKLVDHAIIEPGLERFTLGQLMEEITERATYWNHCAIGERFEPDSQGEEDAKEEILLEGFTSHEANVLIEQGLEFFKLLDKAKTLYLKIQGTTKSSVREIPK